LAEKSIAIAYGRQGFDADALLAALAGLDLNRFIGFVYGSGFEAQPELLVKLAAKLSLIGNSSDTVAAVKTPAVFFAALQQLSINHPIVCDSLPEDYSDDYLMKFAGGSGGTHIRSANLHACLLEDKYYYQQKIDGCPVSLLFLADKHDIQVVGFNEQWLSPSVDAPFRYGGAVSNVKLSTSVQQQLINAAQKLTRKFGLLGLNSLDAIVGETVNAAGQDGQVFVLEINPRLSATVDLYSCMQPSLLERHVNVCLNHDDLLIRHKLNITPVRAEPVEAHKLIHISTGSMRTDSRVNSIGSINQYDMNKLNLQCKAHAIVYAVEEIKLLAPVLWPDWVIDTPQLSEKMFIISSGEPVCSVLAYADSADTAKKIAQNRVEIIQNLLQSLNQDPCTNDCVSSSVQSY
jgi:predicted ATP-grasp superfamily ATP-dependent carboligase